MTLPAAGTPAGTPTLHETPMGQTTADAHARVQVGDMRVSFTMQPCGADGAPLHGGNHYANANTLEGARDYARRVLTAPRDRLFCCMRAVESVDIAGATYEFTGGGWTPRYKRGNYSHHEVITRTEITEQETRQR
jgi:hypothetical protein